MTNASIVGFAHTPFGKLEDPDVESLISRVAGDALKHAEVNPSDVDGIYVGVMNTGFSKQGFEGAQVELSVPELKNTPATHLENACATGSAALFAALDFINSGRGKIALVVGAEKMTAKTVAETGDILLGASYRKEEAEVEGGFAGIFARIAHPYNLYAGVELVPGFAPDATPNAAANVIGTASDYARFADAVMRGRFLNPTTMQRMWTNAVSSTGERFPYAYGWYVEDYRGHRLIYHYGYYDTYSAVLLIAPERELVFVALSNGGALKMTIGEYYTPNGENLAGKGIHPDVYVRDNPASKRDEARETKFCFTFAPETL